MRKYYDLFIYVFIYSKITGKGNATDMP